MHALLEVEFKPIKVPPSCACIQKARKLAVSWSGENSCNNPWKAEKENYTVSWQAIATFRV
jgi:hypothetical protein